MAANGVIGLASLSFLLIALGRLVISSRDRTAGLSVALASIGLAYLMVESPLRLTRWSTGLLVMSVVLTICLSGYRRTEQAETVRQRESIST